MGDKIPLPIMDDRLIILIKKLISIAVDHCPSDHPDWEILQQMANDDFIKTDKPYDKVDSH